MKRWLFVLCTLIFGFARAGELVGLSPEELQSMHNQGALLVDVRTPEELKVTGMIPGSKALTYFDATGGFDKDVWLKQLKGLMKSADQPVILICRSGNRSGNIGKMLADEAGFGKVYHLAKGIREWSAESRPLSPP